jgi:hypothetical protein
MTEPSPDILFERHWAQGGARVDFHVDEKMYSLVVFSGKGSMDGAREFLKMADEAIAFFGPDYKTKITADLQSLRGAPLRSQVLLGKWLLKNKRYVERIAVFGGKRIEMAIAKAVMKIARMTHVGFFNDASSARTFIRS